MSSATALASIGDQGVLNASLPQTLSGIWIDRDLSWLDFNERVLAEALDERTPLLESAKFLAIFTSNLDEFFMKRMAVLRQAETGSGQRSGATASRQVASDAAPVRPIVTGRRSFRTRRARHFSAALGRVDRRVSERKRAATSSPASRRR